VGFQKLLDDAVAAAEGLPDDVVYVGLSLGVLPAQQLAETKPGARGAVLVGSAVPADEFGSWPQGVPLQIHGMDADPVFVGEGDIDAARVLVAEVGAELFLYPGAGHLFIDNSLSDYDEDATELFIERTLALLERVGG
jgi:dienelactone hydrolase